MENDGDETYFLKFAPRSGSQLSNLKSIIDQHFNLPHVQVICGENGGVDRVVLTGLFDGIPDDVDSQDHESFDEILKLIGWVEGCIELPECSKSIAPKVFDESPKAIGRSSDQPVHDEFEVLDEISECDVLKENDPLTKVAMKIDDSVKNVEEMVQSKLKGELILMKEFSNSVAHQLFDEMPRMMDSHEIKLDAPAVSRVASFGAVANQLDLLPSKFSPDKVNPQVQKLVEETYVFNSVACLDLYHFDPGGAWSRSLTDENDKFNLLNKLDAQEKRMNGYAERVCFDPGGQLLILGVSERCAAMGKIYLSFDEFVRCALFTLLQLMLGHHFRRAEMMVFDPGGEFMLAKVCLSKVAATLGIMGYTYAQLVDLLNTKTGKEDQIMCSLSLDAKTAHVSSVGVVWVLGWIMRRKLENIEYKLRVDDGENLIYDKDFEQLVFEEIRFAILLSDNGRRIQNMLPNFSRNTATDLLENLLRAAADVWVCEKAASNDSTLIYEISELLGEVAAGVFDSGQCTTLIFAFDPGGGLSKFNGEFQYCARSSSGYAMCLTNRVEFVPRTNPHFDWSAKGNDAEFMLKIKKTSELQLLQLGFLITTLPIHLYKLLGFLEITHSEALVKVRLLVGAMIVRRDYILAYLLLALSIISTIIMRQRYELSFEVLPSILVNQKIASFEYELKVTSSIIEELPCVREVTAAIFDSRIGITLIFIFDPGGEYFRLIIDQAQKHNALGLLSSIFVPAFEHAIEGLPQNQIRYYLLSSAAIDEIRVLATIGVSGLTKTSTRLHVFDPGGKFAHHVELHHLVIGAYVILILRDKDHLDKGDL